MQFPKTLSSLLLLCIVISTACKKNPPPNNPPEETDPPVMQQFIIEKKNNDWLDADITFQIKDDSIVATKTTKGSKILKPTFTSTATSILVDQKVQKSGETENDFSSAVTYNLKSADGKEKKYIVKVNWLVDSVAHIYINTEGGVAITSKENYVNATISIDGRGKSEDYSGTTQIRGRGNTTWSLPKKPFRLKLTTKAPLFGLATERDWVLLANYIDPTLMMNPVAMKIGRQLNLPYTNNIIPVDVTLNGTYIGSYSFTEQVEVGSSRINIGDDGLLLELDTNFDEDFKFPSKNYDLPVNIKNPELNNSTEVAPIAQQFSNLEVLLKGETFPNNDYKNSIDVESVAKYLLVQMLTDNEEINHPKSVFMHKTTTGKFVMGPIWDFDWAFARESGSHFSSATRPLFWSTKVPLPKGTNIFSRFLDDPAFVTLLKQTWSSYKADHLAELSTFIDQYAKELEFSRNADYKVWKTGSGNFTTDLNKLKNWMTQRVAYIDTYMQGL